MAFTPTHGSVSPDGRLLAYSSDESGQFEIDVRPFPGPGGGWLVSNEGGVSRSGGHSGRELFYRNGDKMMVVPVDTRAAFRADKPIILFEKAFYAPDFANPEYDIAPDDQQFVMIQETATWPTEIQIVLNWTEELERLVPTDKSPL